MPRKHGGSGRGGVRLSGGEHGGRVLSVPPDARPTEGRVREALFAIWVELLPNARFLDLFAGSGAVALEAVGRGAASAVCVEGGRRALAVLERNVRRLGEEGLVSVRPGTLPGALAALEEEGARFDLAFADPPYRFADYAGLVAAVGPVLTADGELAVEHSARRELPLEVHLPGATASPDRLVRVDVRRYGESALTFYRHGPA